jgi:solute carrier family 25 (mitochondrial citrate transporter), member 1
LFESHAAIFFIVGQFAAGAGAGLIESIFAVTPMESIKTITIEKHLDLIPGCKYIYKEMGIGGFYKGLTATALKQMSNQVATKTVTPSALNLVIGVEIHVL